MMIIWNAYFPLALKRQSYYNQQSRGLEEDGNTNASLYSIVTMPQVEKS